MCEVLLINGCSEEGSVSFEQKSSVEVSTSSGINYSSSYTETKSNNGLFVYYTFVIEDPAYKQFNDSFSIDCSFEDVVINPDID